MKTLSSLFHILFLSYYVLVLLTKKESGFFFFQSVFSQSFLNNGLLKFLRPLTDAQFTLPPQGMGADITSLPMGGGALTSIPMGGGGLVPIPMGGGGLSSNMNYQPTGLLGAAGNLLEGLARTNPFGLPMTGTSGGNGLNTGGINYILIPQPTPSGLNNLFNPTNNSMSYGGATGQNFNVQQLPPTLSLQTNNLITPENVHCLRFCPPNVQRPLCASDGVTYLNSCEYEMAKCLNYRLQIVAMDSVCIPDRNSTNLVQSIPLSEMNTGIKIAGLGEENTLPYTPSMCKNIACTKQKDYVCGTDGVTYLNSCLLKLEACLNPSNSNLQVASKGICGQNPGMPTSSVNVLHNPQMPISLSTTFNPSLQIGNPIPTTREACLKPCSDTPDEMMCGSDGNTYMNACLIKQAACLNPSLGLTVVKQGRCEENNFLSVQRPPQVISTPNMAGIPLGMSSYPSYLPPQQDFTFGSTADGMEILKGETVGEALVSRVAALTRGIPLPSHGELERLQEQENLEKIRKKREETISSVELENPNLRDPRRQACNTNCPLTGVPVCGSNGQTYTNVCELHAYACLMNQRVILKHAGSCVKQGPQAERPANQPTLPLTQTLALPEDYPSQLTDATSQTSSQTETLLSHFTRPLPEKNEQTRTQLSQVMEPPPLPEKPITQVTIPIPEPGPQTETSVLSFMDTLPQITPQVEIPLSPLTGPSPEKKPQNYSLPLNITGLPNNPQMETPFSDNAGSSSLNSPQNETSPLNITEPSALTNPQIETLLLNTTDSPPLNNSQMQIPISNSTYSSPVKSSQMQLPLLNITDSFPLNSSQIENTLLNSIGSTQHNITLMKKFALNITDSSLDNSGQSDISSP